jgi:hypothetical protein
MVTSVASSSRPSRRPAPAPVWVSSVQQRVTLAGCPVVETNSQQALSGHVLDTAMAAAGPQVVVRIADPTTESLAMSATTSPLPPRESSEASSVMTVVQSGPSLR